jgi:aminopeptidase N
MHSTLSFLIVDNYVYEWQVLELKEAEQSFTFENIPSEPVPSLLRGFSAPVKLRYATPNQTCAH